MIRKVLLSAFALALVAFVHSGNASAQTVTACADFDKNGVVEIDDILHIAAPLHPMWEVYMDLDGDGDYVVDGVADQDDIDLFIGAMGSTWILGDYNGNGIVSATDLTYLLGSFGNFNPCADLTGDGWVGTEDLLILLGNFGT